MALQFGVSYAGGEREFVRVRRWPFTIGRHAKSDLCLTNSDHISRRHARVLKDGDRYLLVALGRNPTLLNGERIAVNEPAEIRAGDRIELPDYLLDVRDAGAGQLSDSTVHLQVVSTTTIVVRRVASRLGLTRWTLNEIFDWLEKAKGREIRIRHHHATLCLSARISRAKLGDWLNQFDTLIAELDPAQLKVDIHDPSERQAG